MRRRAGGRLGRAAGRQRTLGHLMMELTRTLTFLGSLERLPPGFTWSNVAVPIIWASASEAGMEVVRGCLGSHGISDYPAELM